ncbi:sigma-70 family RNA polymerase sigma factor [Luteolibacter marinus]|uniref:sigma-70 family RNA polymerase sigma factor n=1 Tax=Luteolibacter marinus TaxID=2776705 RepID=UPI0018665F65|nr:sigma-70 family RNA polymerase sigma factor [Luteolibacter marinus]
MEQEPDSVFVKLLTDHQSIIRSFVISLLPGAPGVDDVIQETNVLLWKRRETFEPGTNFKAWALTTARYQAMTYCWILKKRRWVTLDDDVAELVASEMEEKLDRLMVEKRIEALRSCIEEVRPDDRELLMQRYWHKTRLQDFAVIHGRSMNGLKVQLFRLRSALKRCIIAKTGKRCPS